MLGGKDINLEILKAGLAWHYKKYQREQTAQDRILYSKTENNARSNVIGLWSEPDPIAPWNYRHGKKKHTKQAPRPKTPFNNSCGSKRFCKQMTSCKEARFYLTQCGLSRLDRDKDGIPCESICNH